jgi:NAD(P)-dependent dehydrogenase (short-subunit alcohol dehydrogenase family)
MATDFAGETAIVTGAARGIGRAIAERLGGDGATVALADVDAEAVVETADELREAGIEAEAVECDVSSLDDVEALVDRTLDRFGGIDVLVNNAGIGSQAPVHELDPAQWQTVLDVNLTGQFYGIRAAAPAMIDGGGGRIVNISSMAGRNISYHGAANYTASKWGVIGLTKHAAFDLADHDIRVNAVCPGATLTDLVKSGSTEEGREATRQGIPLGRWADPEDQADAVAYLASEDARFVTGTVLEVDGGGSLSHR